MKKDQNLTRVFERYRYDSTIVNKSRTWFQQQVTLLGAKRISKTDLFRQERTVSKITPGSLYLFYYDPKFKEELPYYDRFPLVFPYSATKDGFIGLNMHYLPHFPRVKLFQKLLTYANNDLFDETTKLKYSWSLIKGVSKFRPAQACIKQYLLDHVQSMFIQIKPSDWHTVMMLPIEQFAGANKQTVWKESNKWVR
jgi:hypothetical protein